MAENMVNLTKNTIPESTGVILLIDHDEISVASLILMLKKRSDKSKNNYLLQFLILIITLELIFFFIHMS